MLREFKDPGIHVKYVCWILLAKPCLMIRSWQKSTIGSWWSPHPGRLRCASVCETLGVATPGWSMWFPDWWKVGLASQTMKIEQLENGGWDVENLEIWGNYMFFFSIYPILETLFALFGDYWKGSTIFGMIPNDKHFWFRQLEPGTFQCVMLPGERAPSDLQVSHRFEGRNSDVWWVKNMTFGFFLY